MTLTAIASTQRTQFCRFNGGEKIRARIVDMGKVFRIEWSDGPKMTYTRLDVRPDEANIIDSLGGYWYWNSHRTAEGFNLINAINNNEINCY